MVQYQPNGSGGGGPTLVAPMAVKPTLVRPKAMRPSPAMLARIAQDFQENPPPVYEFDDDVDVDVDVDVEEEQPPLESIEITNVPHLKDKQFLSDDSSVTTATDTSVTNSVTLKHRNSFNTTTTSTNVLDAEPSLDDAQRRLRARRTMSETNFDAAAVFHDDNNSHNNNNNHTFPLGLVKPVAIRPQAIKATSTNPMLTQISHDFAHLPTSQIEVHLPRAPSAPPLQTPIMMPIMPQPVRAQPQRPQINRRQSSSRRSRTKKPSFYHRIAAKNRLGSIQEDPFLSSSDDEDDSSRHNNNNINPYRSSDSMTYNSYYTQAPWERIQAAKKDLLQELNRIALLPEVQGNNSPAVLAALQSLAHLYDSSLFDPRAPVLAYHPYQMQLEGIGISAGKPTFPGCIGRNTQGDPLYKLGTMSFDMFRPTELVVSVQGTFCLIDGVDRNNLQDLQNVPKHLLNDVRDGINPVRHYNIVTPFTIEPYSPDFGEHSPNKGVQEPITGVMTTYGFILPYPTGNRFSVWFTGGSLEVDGHKNEKWFQIFDKKAAPRRTALETGKVLAAKLLMGAEINDEMDSNGTLKYTLTRPVASYIDLVYLDDSLSVLRGSKGTVFVHVRLPGGSGAVYQSTHCDQMLPAPRDPLASSHVSPTHRFLI